MWQLKRTKNKQEEAGVGPFFKDSTFLTTFCLIIWNVVAYCCLTAMSRLCWLNYCIKLVSFKLKYIFYLQKCSAKLKVPQEGRLAMFLHRNCAYIQIAFKFILSCLDSNAKNTALPNFAITLTYLNSWLFVWSAV